jgi:hypothetical protein
LGILGSLKEWDVGKSAVVLIVLLLAGCTPVGQAGSGTLSSVFNVSAVTLANYTKLESGMTYAQVVQILGEPGEELSRGSFGGTTTVMYMWRGRGRIGANMNAMFQDDRLISKAQFGLQ